MYNLILKIWQALNLIVVSLFSGVIIFLPFISFAEVQFYLQSDQMYVNLSIPNTLQVNWNWQNNDFPSGGYVQLQYDLGDSGNPYQVFRCQDTSSAVALNSTYGTVTSNIDTTGFSSLTDAYLMASDEPWVDSDGCFTGSTQIFYGFFQPPGGGPADNALMLSLPDSSSSSTELCLISTTTASIEQSEENLWYAYWTFFATMFFVVWLLRKN